MIPIMDLMVYPALRKAGIQFTAIKKITLGFFLASIAMVCAAVTQHYIYQTSPCGYSAATCEQTSPLNVWIQSERKNFHYPEYNGRLLIPPFLLPPCAPPPKSPDLRPHWYLGDLRQHHWSRVCFQQGVST